MPSNPIHFSDKENAVRQQPIIGNKQSGALSTKSGNIAGGMENAISIRSVGKQSKQNSLRGPIARVPLGGKDQNKAVPTLQRSQSSLNSANDNKQRKKILLPKKPSLLKANSSLGFIHRSNLAKDKESDAGGACPSVYESEEKWVSSELTKKVRIRDINKSIFNPDDAIRSKDLVQATDTDSLKKQILHRSTSLVGTEAPPLSSTISAETKKLDASSIQENDIYKNNLDPIKKSPKRSPVRKKDFVANKAIKPSTESGRLFQVHQDLTDYEDSIEYVPKKEPALPYNPVDVEPLNEEDLELFSKPNRLVITKENQYDYPEFHQNEMDLKFEEIDLNNPNNLVFEYDEDDDKSKLISNENEPKEINNIGLSVNELNDLLDL